MRQIPQNAGTPQKLSPWKISAGDKSRRRSFVALRPQGPGPAPSPSAARASPGRLGPRRRLRRGWGAGAAVETRRAAEAASISSD